MNNLNSLVIYLERLKHPKKPLDTTSPSSFIKKHYPNIYSTSIDKEIVDYEQHPVLQGFIDAYKQHRPITISPDIIWLLVVQGFTHHVLNNFEDLRSKFVNFTGTQELTVNRNDMTPETATNDDWQGIFAEFVGQISSYTGNKVEETLTPCFSTTTTVSLAVGQLSIMCAMKKYFEYRCEMAGCGIPSVTVEGTVNDWEIIVRKLDELREYDLDWWIDVIQPLVQEIVKTKKSTVCNRQLKSFWRNIVRYKDSKGFYEPEYADGWLMSFFPYDINGKRSSLNQIYDVSQIPNEMLEIPFNLVLYSPGQNPRSVAPKKCQFIAGFVGLIQDPKSLNIKPEIGWVVLPKSKTE